jgi:hypothetical protein
MCLNALDDVNLGDTLFQEAEENENLLFVNY